MQITIPKSDYQALLREVRRAADICAEVAGLRFALQGLAVQSLLPRGEGDSTENLKRAVESCEEIGRLRVELLSLERRLRELDSSSEVTPLRPSSAMSLKLAFDTANDFASGKKKPPEGSGRY